MMGCIPHLVLTGKGIKTQEKGGLPPGTQIYPNLEAMVDQLLSNSLQAELNFAV